MIYVCFTFAEHNGRRRNRKLRYEPPEPGRDLCESHEIEFEPRPKHLDR